MVCGYLQIAVLSTLLRIFSVGYTVEEARGVHSVV